MTTPAPETWADYDAAGCRHMAAACALLKAPTRPGLDPNGHAKVAAYLAGYAIECALKVHLIRKAQAAATASAGKPPADLSGAAQAFRASGSMGSKLIAKAQREKWHDLISLMAATGLDYKMGIVEKQYWSICQSWQVADRYRDVWKGRAREARSLVRAVLALYRWIIQQTATAP